MAAYSLADTNLFAYCRNNPVMYTDMTGNAPTWWQWTISGALVVSGIACMFVPALAPISGMLISAGVNSIISGYVNEAIGGSYTAGWYGGAALGVFGGLGATAAASCFGAAAASCGMPVISNLAKGMLYGYGLGALGSFSSGAITSYLDNTKFDLQNNFYLANITGASVALAGFGGMMSNGILAAGNMSTGNVALYGTLASGITLGTELFCDSISASPPIFSLYVPSWARW